MKKKKGSTVKAGGVANKDSEIADVTRDTYGFGEARPVKQNPDERISDADRAAATVGVPGVAVPESAGPEPSEEEREDEFRRAEIAGDRTASRRDVENLETPDRE